MSKSPAWTRKEGKSESGGLNEKGRASLRAQGHDIKRPQPEGGSRRDSFCARMKGMKEKLTSSDTASDPDSRINKSLRKWNCASGGEVWDKARPKDLGKPEKLSPSEKKSAKAAAKAAGRPYPNLVDNMRAARADGGTVGRAGQLLARAKGYATGGNPTADEYIGPSRYHENFGSDVADNVGQVYRYFSGRDPDAAGLGFWTQGIGGGKASYDDLAYALARSPESTINQLYQIYSGRDVDPAGRQFWSDAINSGRATFDTLADALEQSPEGQRYLIQEARNRSRDTATDAGSPGIAGTVQFASPDLSWYQKARPVPNSSEELVKFFAPIEKQYNLPAGSLLGMMGNESTYGANQHRKGSDFKGAFQMSSDLTKRFEVRNPYDWQEQAVAAAKYMAENRDFFIKKTGREPLPHEYYNMHQQGPNGYAAIAKHPNIPAVDALVMEGVYKPAAALKAIRNNMPPSQKGKADARHILASDFSGGWGVDFNRKMNGPDGQGVTMIANYGQTPTVASDKPVTPPPTTQPPTVAPGTGLLGGYNTLDELIQSTLPPPPPPPANYQEAVAKYKQDYANWENSVRAWQMNDAAMNKGKIGPVPAMIMNNRPTPPNPADWGNPSGGEYRPEPPPPTSQLQPINQGAGTQVNPQINYPSPPPVTNPSPTPMPGAGQTFVPQGTPTQVNWAPMQNMIAGSQLASQFAGANTGYGGPGIAAPSGLPSYGGMSTPAVTGGVSFMRKAGGRVGRADGGHLDRLMARISEKTVEDQKKKYDTGPKEGEPVLTQGPEPTFWDKIKDRMMGDRPSPERRQFVEGLGNIADVGHMGAYATPLAPYVGAADFAHGLASGDRLETLMSAAGLPGRGAKMAGAAIGAMAPDEASASPFSKMLLELAERYRPHYDPSARVLGQPRKEWLSSVKLSRPLEEMSVVRRNPREMLPENFITPSDLEGKALITGLGDRTPAGYEVTAINGRKLRSPVNMMGGPGFARDVAAQGPDRSVWASGLSRAQALANRARAAQEKGLDPIFTYVAQGPESGDFSHHMLDAVLGQLDRRKMDPELAGRIDRRMREFQTGSGETFAPKPDWVGISSPDAAARMRERADERVKLIKEMDAAAYRDAPGFADIGAARFATTDPNFMFDPGFSAGKSFMRMTPGEVVKQPAIAHPSYDTHLPAPGEGPGYMGRLEYELPPELHYKKYREEEIKPELRGKPLSKQTMSILKQVPTVEATPEWVDMASEWQDIMRRQYGSRRP